MPERFDGPVQVRRDGRETIIDGAVVMVGREIPAPGGGPLGFDPGTVLELDEQVLADPDSTVDSGPFARLIVGDDDLPGAVTVLDTEANPTISLRGGFGTFGTGKQSGGVTVRGATNGPVILLTGKDGRITFFDARVSTTLTIDGEAGDITFAGADCAEDFDVADDPLPGSVMCLDDDGAIRCCSDPYDSRVAGVVSGAGGLPAAVHLGRQPGAVSRVPVALVGKVFCLVEAEQAPIEVGHLLTTSAVLGHAMRAADPARSFGSVLGKSLGSLREGRGLVPILVALQ